MTHISQVMNPTAATIAADQTVEEAARQMVACDVRLLPVLEEGELAGVVTHGDIVRRVVATGRDPRSVAVHEIMTRDVDTVADYQHVEDVTELMRHKKRRRLLVLDRDNYPVGVVSIADLAARLQDPRLCGELLADVLHPPVPPSAR